MNRIYAFDLPFDYTLFLTQNELFFWGVVLFIIFALIVKSFFTEVRGGREGMSGQKVAALGDFAKNGENYKGLVLCMGEIWSAKADFPMKKGDRSAVFDSIGLVLFLSKKQWRKNSVDNNDENNDGDREEQI